MSEVPTPARRAGETFSRVLGGEPTGLWFAPGRVNLIGEHTDYNDGFVLPMALAQGAGIAGRAREDRLLRVRSAQADEPVDLDLDDLAPGSSTGPAGWAAYPAGVAWALREAGMPLRGADLVIDSDVPLGAGLSSSHALECAVALALLGLAGATVDPTRVAEIVRTAENDFVGAPTGIMDQMASLHGRADHLVFLDTRALEVEHVAWRLADHGLALLVVDTGTPHSLVEGEYADRRTACEQGAAELGVRALRDVPAEGLDARLRDLDPVVARRVRHVVTEDARVLAVVDRLRAGADPRAIGPALTASHVSMRDDFEISAPPVDVAVRAALDAGAHGARMTGGGFGGCVLALVDAGAVEPVAAAVEAAFASHELDRPSWFVATAGDGARRVG